MNTTAPVEVRSLLPLPTILDILLPPALIALSLLLHTINNEPTPLTTHAHIFYATTAHARFLPALAKHIFSYPVLFFGVDLERLENNQLDLGRLFGYEPSRWSLTSLRREGYLEEQQEKPQKKIRERLLGHLLKEGVELKDAERIYCVTMPGYLGFEGINPLTIHFCYGKEVEGLKAVVLEVHNTFGERHIYVLRVGVAEDATASKGFDYQWAFPRAFHVSPFNDRSGFYRVSLSDPLATLSPTTSTTLPFHPNLRIKIVFLTPSHEKKIYASLTGIGRPLTPGTLLSALLKFPFSLLLTTPRILWQATKLHYSKRLDVFPRPEPFVKSLMDRDNPVEGGGKFGSVGWQPPSATDDWAKEKFIEFLERRLKEMHLEGRDVEVILRPEDVSRPTIRVSPPVSSSETLSISYLTPLFFTDLLTSPTILLGLSLTNSITHRWKTSNDELFLRTFSPAPLTSPSFLSLLASRIRHSIYVWSLSFSRLHTSSLEPPSPSYHHPLDEPKPSFKLVWTLLSHFFWLKFGYWVFVLSGARFVKGMESWTEWARLAELESGGEEKKEIGFKEFGSVRRP